MGAMAWNPQSEHVIVENQEKPLFGDLFAISQKRQQIKPFTLKNLKRIATFLGLQAQVLHQRGCQLLSVEYMIGVPATIRHHSLGQCPVNIVLRCGAIIKLAAITTHLNQPLNISELRDVVLCFCRDWPSHQAENDGYGYGKLCADSNNTSPEVSWQRNLLNVFQNRLRVTIVSWNGHRLPRGFFFCQVLNFKKITEQK